ncbi:MAG: outer membrane beta-barrel protein [Ignavibacteriota bacterium]
MVKIRLLILLPIFLSCSGMALAQSVPDSTTPLPEIIVFAEVSGFIPFSQSYRINYQTNLGGLPIEVTGGIGFPLNPSLSGIFSIRYKRRAAIFIPDFQIKTLEIELGLRGYLEKEHEKDLRLYGSGGPLLARSTVTGNLDATGDGHNITVTEVSQDYYNVGLGIGLGIEYPTARNSGLYFGFQIGIYFADKVETGGLGNIGGVSIGLGYHSGL